MGQGNKKADLVIVSDMPNSRGSVLGRPFTSREGRMIQRVLKEANIDAKKVYITNAIKVRLPDNHRPTKQEIDYWRPALKAEITLIRPKRIITLGNVSRQAVYGAQAPAKVLQITDKKGIVRDLKEGEKDPGRTGEWRKGHLE